MEASAPLKVLHIDTGTGWRGGQQQVFWVLEQAGAKKIVGNAGVGAVNAMLDPGDLVLADDVPAEKLDKAIRQGAGAPLVDLDLFDVYRGAGIGAGRRSLAYRLRLQAADRNLTDADVAEVRAGVTAAAAKLGAELRG